MNKTVQMIFKAQNDRGEPLIEVAARQGEIWTARAKTCCKEGDRILLKRSGRGKVVYEGVVKEVELLEGDNGWIMWSGFIEHCRCSGFSNASDWLDAYIELSGIVEPDKAYFIHITNIKPYVKPPRKRAKGVSDEPDQD